MFRRAAVALVLIAFAGEARPASLHLGRSSNQSNISLRKRLHVNTLIAEPGTIEIDWDTLYSYTSANYSMPSTIKWTPEGKSIWWGRTEYGLSFDSVDSALVGGDRSTQFSDRLTFTPTAVLKDGDKWDIAIAPQATFFLRGEKGVRLGATVITRVDGGRNSLGATAAWTAATSPSPNNPAGTWDFGGGYGRRLAASGVLGHFTPHVNVVLERSTGVERITSAFGGVEYQMTERVAFDVTGQRLGWFGGQPDRQFAAGMTVNLGKHF